MVTEPMYIDASTGAYMGAQTFYGLSTDTKPTSCGNGSVFIAVDTGTAVFFDAENKLWTGETPDEGDATPDAGGGS